MRDFSFDRASVYRLNVKSGAREHWHDFDPRDPAGVDGIFTILLRPDAQAWVYGYIRNLSNLYVVEGLS